MYMKEQISNVEHQYEGPQRPFKGPPGIIIPDYDWLKGRGGKSISGFTSDGLHFYINVDSFGDDKARFSFIEHNVAPLIDSYAEKLSKAKNHEEIIKELIKTVYDSYLEEIRVKYNYKCESKFDMSIGIT